MSALAKIQSATVTGGGNNVRDGRYKLLVEKCEYSKGFQGERFVAELRVIEASATGLLDESGRPVAPNAVGTTYSLVCLLDKLTLFLRTRA